MEKRLDKLSRMELLQLLMKASQANEELVAENSTLREQLAQGRQRLPRAEKVGSIAEAALQANGYFDAAQRAADDYLREIKRLRDQVAARAEAAQAQDNGAFAGQAQACQASVQAPVQDAQARATEIVGQANLQAQAIMSQARTRSDALMSSARAQSDAIVADANQQARLIIAQANRRADAIVESTGRKGQGRASAYGSVSGAAGVLSGRGRHVKLPDGVMA